VYRVFSYSHRPSGTPYTSAVYSSRPGGRLFRNEKKKTQKGSLAVRECKTPRIHVSSHVLSKKQHGEDRLTGTFSRSRTGLGGGLLFSRRGISTSILELCWRNFGAQNWAPWATQHQETLQIAVANPARILEGCRRRCCFQRCLTKRTQKNASASASCSARRGTARWSSLVSSRTVPRMIAASFETEVI
jgi:hypothetical protein